MTKKNLHKLLKGEITPRVLLQKHISYGYHQSENYWHNSSHFKNPLRNTGSKPLTVTRMLRILRRQCGNCDIPVHFLFFFSTTNHYVLRNLGLLFLCNGHIRKQQQQQQSTRLLIMSSNFARSVCGNAGSSSSSCGGASPWPCSSGGVAGEFSLEESGDEVLIKNQIFQI